MKKKDFEDLKKILGAKVVDILINPDDPDDYGFELVFDNGYALEVYIDYDVEDLDHKPAFAGWTISRIKQKSK